MISITRDLARRLRAVLKKAGVGRHDHPVLEFRSGLGYLRVRTQVPDMALEYKQQSPDAEESLRLPGEALADIEGKSSAPVTLTCSSNGVEASWEDGKIPRRKSYELAKSAKGPTIPEVDWSKGVVVPGLLQALEAASQCVAKDNVRFATNRIQLRGAHGEIISSDGRQALIQGGFTFAWKEDLLIPTTALFGCRELPADLPASVCIGETHLGIQVGDWSVYLLIDKQGRFPDVGKLIPKVTASATTLRLSPEDAEFLAKSVDKLPGSHDECAPITIDLNGQVALRAREEGQGPPTEVVLAGSTVVGSPVCWHSDRRFLARAVSFGFSEVSIIDAATPIVCKDKTRTYCWVPLGKACVIPASDGATRITTEDTVGVPPEKEISRNEPTVERNVPMAQPHTNGETNGTGEAHAEESPTKANTLAGLIVEAQNLRDYLHEGYARANRLVSRLKNHRKQSKLVATTLASLRQLQQIEA